MFWNSNKPPAPPRVTPLSISRAEHLSSYRNHPVLGPSTRRVSDDTFDTVFETITGLALLLRIYLPADVNRTPSMTLHGIRATHTWLDEGMRVIGYPQTASDESWRASNMMLGDAVYAILRHFQENPPELLEVTDHNLRRWHESLLNRNHIGPPPDIPADTLVPNDVNDIDDNDVNGLIPPIPLSFPEFETMSLPQVKQIAENESFRDLYVEARPEVANLRELKSSFEASNVESARINLAHQSNIEALSTKIKTLQQNLSDKVQQYQILDAERLALTQPPQINDVINRLNQAKRVVLRESDNFAERWVEGGGDDVSDFVQKFIDVRLIYRTREAKADILRHQENASSHS